MKAIGRQQSGRAHVEVVLRHSYDACPVFGHLGVWVLRVGAAGGPNYVEPRLLAAVRGLLATSSVGGGEPDLEVLGSWERPLNKQSEVSML